MVASPPWLEGGALKAVVLAVLLVACARHPSGEKVRVVIGARLPVAGVPVAETFAALRASGKLDKASPADWFQVWSDSDLLNGYAVEPEFFAIPSQLDIERKAVDAFAVDSHACLIDAALSEHRGWKVGDEVDDLDCRVAGLVDTRDREDYGQVFLRWENHRHRADRADVIVVSVARSDLFALVSDLTGRFLDIRVAIDDDRTWGRQLRP